MASTTTINGWSEQLVHSLLPDHTSSAKLRKHVEQFKRSLKHHNYVTTNQFEIEERLNGLEEKFQVLNQAELSDALQQRRSELLQHQHRWIPDALDLLLKLSHHLLRYSHIEHLDVPKKQTSVPVSMKWSDLDVDDPIDRRSKIWRLPDYTDFSSDEDEVLPSSADTSPEKETRIRKGAYPVSESSIRAIQTVPDPNLASKFKAGLFWGREEGKTITEPQVVREVLFMVQGYPTSLFTGLDGQMLPNPRFKLNNLSQKSLGSVLLSAVGIAKAAHFVRKWSTPHQKLPFMQILETGIKGILKSFDDTVSELQTQHLRIVKEGGVVSLLQSVEQLRKTSPALQAAQAFVQDVKHQDPIGHIDVLFGYVCKQQHLADSKSYEALMKVLLQTIKSYARQIDHWIQKGMISESSGCFFVQRVADQGDKARFWQSWYSYTASGPNRPPKCFHPFAKQIFTCGRTIAFASLMGFISPPSGNRQTVSSIIEAATSASSSSLQAFAATLSDSLTEYIISSLHSATRLLQATLQQKCNLTSTLCLVSGLYLSGSPLGTYNIDARLFSHLDHCQHTWNDRFLISDLLSETHADTQLDINRIIVHSEPTAASALATARRSVDVLANIAFDYLLPWPIANILLPETLASYRRVSLLLVQLRRAKYVLERRAYLRLRLFSGSQTHFRLSQRATGLYATLLMFTITLYAHLTSCVISPLTRQLHNAISGSSWTVDDLISLHSTYLRNLEFSCLTTKDLKVLKDAVIGLLDICVGFGFTLSDPSGTQNTVKDNSNDVEATIQKLSAQFSKQLDFLIAGLRGVARSNAAAASSSSEGPAYVWGGGTDLNLKEGWKASGEMMELLADSLESTLAGRRGQFR